jgi:hypothetical protein
MSDYWPPHSGVARASQPYFLRLILSSRRRYRFGFACSGLRPLHQSTLPSADSCPPLTPPLGETSLTQVDRSPRVRRVTFTPCPPCLRPSVPDDFGLRIPTLPRPQTIASYTVRVPQVRALPAASFRPHLAADALAVRLGVPVIKASRGLAPPSHFPARFRSPVDSAVMALRAMPGAHRVAGAVRPQLPHHRTYGSVYGGSRGAWHQGRSAWRPMEHPVVLPGNRPGPSTLGPLARHLPQIARETPATGATGSVLRQAG